MVYTVTVFKNNGWQLCVDLIENISNTNYQKCEIKELKEITENSIEACKFFGDLFFFLFFF